MKLTDMKVIVTLCLVIGGAGYTSAKVFATYDDLKLVSTKVEMALDLSVESLQERLILLEIKPNKTAYDLAKIKFLQGEIARLRKLRSL